MSEETHAADDIFVVGEVSFAIFAAVDFAAIQVDVVRQTHDG
jgi:hypothetical protein